MVVGDHRSFPYRSSTYITRFFERCGLAFRHDGSTRRWWAKDRLEELNLLPASSPDLPSDDLLVVISELFDRIDFDEQGKDLESALEALNKLLARDGLEAYLDDTSGVCYVRNTGTGARSEATGHRQHPLSPEEALLRHKLATFLDAASEDEFTERLLVPFFQRLGFHRVTAAGHREKILEFGKDLWMKYQLPTGHWLYFCAQVKRTKIDASSDGGGSSVAELLA